MCGGGGGGGVWCVVLTCDLQNMSVQARQLVHQITGAMSLWT